MPFLRFMSRTAGRATRIVAGAALIVVGAALGGGWYALIGVGLIPLLAGALDVCVLAPLLRQPFAGSRFRAATSR